MHNLWKFQLSIFNGLEMVRYGMKGLKKCKKLNLFQLCSVIFPTMITEVQIFDATHYP